jgi:hypothetical protein
VLLVEKATQVRESYSLVECRVLPPKSEGEGEDGREGVVSEGTWVETQAISQEGTPKWLVS